MTTRGTVLVTGAGGFIGRALCDGLETAGWHVVRWARQTTPTVHGVDLMDRDAIRRALDALPRLDTIVHLAALNRDLDRTPDHEVLRLNVGLLSNLLDALGSRQVRLVFASSVAVYAPCCSDEPRGVHTVPRPVTAYGAAKLACEQLLAASSQRDFDVVRLPPVYSEAVRDDLAKRVYVPGLRLRMRLRPPPSYTTLPICSIVDAVVSLAGLSTKGRRLHVVGGVEVGQDTLAASFSGRQITVPVALIRPIVHALNVGPRAARRIADKLGKVCFSNRYAAGVMDLPAMR